MSRSRSRTTAVAAAMTLALLLAACGGGGGSSAAGVITLAPGSDVLVSQDRNPILARNSPSVVVNPTQRTNMVIVDRVDRPDYTAGVHVTNNGGANWQDVPLKAPAGSGKLYAPAAAYDHDGRLYVSYVTLTGPGNSPDGFWVARSGDGGLSFDEPTRIAGPNTYQTTIAADPKGRRIFAAWLQSNADASECELCFSKTGLPIMASRSDDGGRTWTDPTPVSDGARARVGAPSLAVDQDGNPSVVYLDFGNDRVDWENLPGTYDGTFSLVLTRSADQGAGWGPGRVVDSGIVPTGRFVIYLPVTAAFAIGRDGAMVAAWADRRNGDPDILLRRSTDDGQTWGKVIKVNRGTTGDGIPQDLPSVSVSPGGRIDVAYYDRSIDRSGSGADVLLSSSLNSGRSFDKTFRLSGRQSNRKVGPKGSPHSPEADFGTRIGIASLPGGAVAAWTDTRDGTPEGGKQDIYAAAVPLSDNTSLSLAFKLLAGFGLLLGLAGISLFVMSRRGRKADSAQPPP